MPPDDRARLRHIVEYGATVSRFIDGRVRDDRTDEMLRLALARATEIIGEPRPNLPDVQRRYPAIPWAQLIGMRTGSFTPYSSIDTGILGELAARRVLHSFG